MEKIDGILHWLHSDPKGSCLDYMVKSEFTGIQKLILSISEYKDFHCLQKCGNCLLFQSPELYNRWWWIENWSWYTLQNDIQEAYLMFSRSNINKHRRSKSVSACTRNYEEHSLLGCVLKFLHKLYKTI